MKMKKGALFLSLMMVVVLSVMVMVPMVSADETTTDMQVQEKITNEWQESHKFKVTQTTISTYKDGVYETITIYSGNGLKEKLGIENFIVVRKIPLESQDAVKFGIIESNPKISKKESYEVFTTATDPPRILRSYPQWIYEKDIWGNYHQLNEPTNMIWKYSTLTDVRNEIWIDHDWYHVMVPYEDTYYIYDGGWRADYGLADDPFRLSGGYHIRLWELSDGDVIGAAHQDSSFPHHAVGFENAENLIAGFFQDPDDSAWRVYPNLEYLGNQVSSPYNNGYATMTYV